MERVREKGITMMWVNLWVLVTMAIPAGIFWFLGWFGHEVYVAKKPQNAICEYNKEFLMKLSKIAADMAEKAGD